MKNKALFLIDGTHKPNNSIFSIKELCKRFNVKVSALVWIGGTEKLESKDKFKNIFKDEFNVEVYFPLDADNNCVPEKGIKKILSENSDIKTVVQLSGAPQIFRKLTVKYALIASAYEAKYIAGGTVFNEYRVKMRHSNPSLGLYATNKRVGKTSFGSYIGNLVAGLKGGNTPWKPVVITHSRGGPPDPPLIEIHKRSKEKPLSEITIDDILTSRFKEEYLEKLVDFGLHGASDVFEDALILSKYLDEWEKKDKKVPYLSMIGCRRAGGGYFNEFVVSNADKGIEKANSSEANLTIHEGSGGEHPPVAVDNIIFFIPADVPLDLLEDFPGLEKARLFIIANCQPETVKPDRVKQVAGIIKKRVSDSRIFNTRFIPEIVGETESLKNKKCAFFTTAPEYILDKLANQLEKFYGCKMVGVYNNLDSDQEMKNTIDDIVKKGVEVNLFEIKARGVEGAKYSDRKYELDTRYVNNIPQHVDENFKPAVNNNKLDSAIINEIERTEKLFEN
ncbi:MAG: hypothetical protein ACQEQC_02460 [Elusimicrobiota bacterium]